jgi:RNA polymerase sigma factor (TIGR02999 family)
MLQISCNPKRRSRMAPGALICTFRSTPVWAYYAMSDITPVLDRVAAGESQAAEDLLPLVYGELRKLAAARMADEPGYQTLQPTALVHEAWLRLSGSEPRRWENRAHFFAAAAEAMRRILIDRARQKRALKRNAGTERIDLDRVYVAVQADDEVLLLVNDAMEKLSTQDPKSAELVKLRFFVGMSYQEAAQALGISERSGKRYWTFARAWLY